MFKKTLTTIIATVTALSITILPVSAAEPGYVTVGDAAHGYVDVPSDWVQSDVVLYYTAGELAGQPQDIIGWDSADGNQSIVLRRENVPSNGLSEQESITNLSSWVNGRQTRYPDEYQDYDMGDAGTIAGHKAFWASWTTPGQYTIDGSAYSAVVYYFVDDNYIYNIEVQTLNGENDQALQAVATFHF